MCYEWYYDGKRGLEDTYDGAVEAIEHYMGKSIDKLYISHASNGTDEETTYFYHTEKALEADNDGAYTPQISKIDDNCKEVWDRYGL